jgi:hypothetical protein
VWNIEINLLPSPYVSTIISVIIRWFQSDVLLSCKANLLIWAHIYNISIVYVKLLNCKILKLIKILNYYNTSIVNTNWCIGVCVKQFWGGTLLGCNLLRLRAQFNIHSWVGLWMWQSMMFLLYRYRLWMFALVCYLLTYLLTYLLYSLFHYISNRLKP